MYQFSTLQTPIETLFIDTPTIFPGIILTTAPEVRIKSLYHAAAIY